jgi:hypothetical protein
MTTGEIKDIMKRQNEEIKDKNKIEQGKSRHRYKRCAYDRIKKNGRNLNE